MGLNGFLAFMERMDNLSACRLLLLQRKPKLGLPKPSTGPHAARRLDCFSTS